MTEIPRFAWFATTVLPSDRLFVVSIDGVAVCPLPFVAVAVAVVVVVVVAFESACSYR
jgi:hypothetical protein